MRKLLTIAFICLIIFTACAPVAPTALPTTTIAPTNTVTPAPTASPTLVPSPTFPQPTKTPDTRITDRETVLSNATAFVEAFEEKLQTTGWIRKVFTRVYFDNRQKEYLPEEVLEEWYLLDESGRRIDGYIWTATLEGSVLQEAIFQEGLYYNITYDRWSRDQNYEANFAGNSLAQLEMGATVAQEEVEYYGAAAWKITSEFLDGGLPVVIAFYIHLGSGMIIGEEIYAVEDDGSLLLVSGAVNQHWEIDAQPPLERFEDMRQRAEKQSP